MAQDNSNNPIEITTKSQLKVWFKTQSKPLQSQYYAWMDAYWHKSELISQSKISGLAESLANKADADQLQYYAKSDASNINEELAQAWREILGVSAELPPNIATIDYPSGNQILLGNAYAKVEDPNDGNVYVLNINGSKVNANTFGKNITNSSNTTNGSYIQTQRIGDTFYWDTNGQSWGLKNLPDKSADANFTDFVGKNSQGVFGKVGYRAFIGTLGSMTNAELLAIGQLINGGTGSAGNINVNLISPSVVQKIDSDEYVLLRGVNLNLNATAKKIEIINATTQTVIATIPDNQIQLKDDGLTLVFYYNFKNIPFGNYLIRLTSGAKVYVTTLELRVLENIENINTASILWNRIYDAGVTPNPGDISSGANVLINTPTDPSPSGIQKVSFKSDEIFAQGDNWYLEMKIDISRVGGDSNVSQTFIGMCYSNVSNVLVPLPIVYANTENYGGSCLLSNNGNKLGGQNAYNYATSLNVVFIKQGNLFRTILTSNTVSGVMSSTFETTLTNNSGYSVSIQTPARKTADGLQVQILRAYKYN